MQSDRHIGVRLASIRNVGVEHDRAGCRNHMPHAVGGLDDPHALGGGSYQDGDRACP
jgi:hypothetical protein